MLIQIHLLAKTFLHFLDFRARKTKQGFACRVIYSSLYITEQTAPHTAGRASAYLVTVHIAIDEK